MSTKAPEVPSLAWVLSIFAYHISSLTEEKPIRREAPYGNRVRFSIGLGGFGEGCPLANVDVVITPATEDPTTTDAWGPWAQVWMRPISDKATTVAERNTEPNVLDGTWKQVGNRSAGRNHYAELCAPVIAWVAQYHATKGKGA